jgi:hypothetical protein
VVNEQVNDLHLKTVAIQLGKAGFQGFSAGAMTATSVAH